MSATTHTPIREAAGRFLENRRIAVTGVSHAPQGHGSNAVYTFLRDQGYDVFAVNPNAPEVEGDATFPDLHAIPGGVDAVVVGTRPDHALGTVQECAELGIDQVWMHRAFGKGSVSDAATAYGREHGLTVIDGGCPLMFAAAGDKAHRGLCRVLTWTGKVPRKV